MTEVIIGLIGICGTVIAYFAGRRKSKADADNSELEATGKAITIWREMAMEFKQQADELKKEKELNKTKK